MKHPENFLGMHFFNPVHRMPLVEVIYGAARPPRKRSPRPRPTPRRWARPPIVVKNCPGFLVNRILFPYFGGWSMLLRDGGEYQQIDKVMENLRLADGPGLPAGRGRHRHLAPRRRRAGRGLSGPHVQQGIQVRARRDVREAKRYGQKNGIGFYKYETDPKGKPKKVGRSADRAS